MPSTTNGFRYPAATDTPDVPRDVQNLATDVESKLGALTAAATTYTPTLTNVTGGTVTGRWIQVGKILYWWVEITAGTVTALGTVTVSLPAGKTADAAVGTAVTGVRSQTPISARVAPAATTAILADGAGASFAAALSLALTRLSGAILVQ